MAGDSSPSGQQPNDLIWFLKTPQHRNHAALLSRLYDQPARLMPAYAAYAHVHYARMTASPAQSAQWIASGDQSFRCNELDSVIPFSRSHFLTHAYTDEKLIDGRRKCELEIRRCRNRQGQYMAHISEGGAVCPVCAKDSRGL